MLSILIIDTPSLARFQLERIADVTVCKTKQEIIEKLGTGRYAAVVCGLRRNNSSRMQLVSKVRASYPDVAFVIAISGRFHIRSALLAMIDGASGFIAPSRSSEDLARQLQAAIRRNRIDRIVQDAYGRSAR